MGSSYWPFQLCHLRRSVWVVWMGRPHKHDSILYCWLLQCSELVIEILTYT
jgi:hypothetical protein